MPYFYENYNPVDLRKRPDKPNRKNDRLTANVNKGKVQIDQVKHRTQQQGNKLML